MASVSSIIFTRRCFMQYTDRRAFCPNDMDEEQIWNDLFRAKRKASKHLIKIEGQALYSRAVMTLCERQKIPVPTTNVAEVFPYSDPRHVCERCEMDSFNRNDVVRHDKGSLIATGDVYICMSSGFLHWCRSKNCVFSCVRNGRRVCVFSGITLKETVAMTTMNVSRNTNRSNPAQSYYLSNAKQAAACRLQERLDTMDNEYSHTKDYAIFFGAEIATRVVERKTNVNFFLEASMIVHALFDHRRLEARLGDEFYLEEPIKRKLEDEKFVDQIVRNAYYLYNLLYKVDACHQAFCQMFVLVYLETMTEGYYYDLSNVELHDDVPPDLADEVRSLRICVIPRNAIVEAILPKDQALRQYMLGGNRYLRKTNHGQLIRKIRFLRNHLKDMFKMHIEEYRGSKERERLATLVESLMLFRYPEHDDPAT